MVTVLDAQKSYKEARAAFRIAQMDPSISDADKLLQRDKMDMLADNTVDSFAQSRSARGDLDLDFVPPSESIDEGNILERNNIAQDEEKDKEKDAQDDDDDDGDDDPENDAQTDDDKKEDDKERDAQIKKLNQKIAQMEYKEAKMKLAQKYGNLFTEGLREARTTQFNSLNEPIKVLTARVDEAATLLSKGGAALKVAGVENGLFNLEDLDGNSTYVNPGAKI